MNVPVSETVTGMAMKFDFYRDSLGKSKDGKDIFLKDIWPSNK